MFERMHRRGPIDIVERDRDWSRTDCVPPDPELDYPQARKYRPSSSFPQSAPPITLALLPPVYCPYGLFLLSATSFCRHLRPCSVVQLHTRRDTLAILPNRCMLPSDVLAALGASHRADLRLRLSLF